MAARQATRASDERFRADLQRLTEYALRLVPFSRDRAAQLVTPQRGLYVLRQHEPTAFEANIYHPMLCLILEGCKEMTFGERKVRLRVGECALVSHDLPIVSRVGEAPYLVLLLDVDVDVLRSLYEDVGE